MNPAESSTSSVPTNAPSAPLPSRFPSFHPSDRPHTSTPTISQPSKNVTSPPSSLSTTFCVKPTKSPHTSAPSQFPSLRPSFLPSVTSPTISPTVPPSSAPTFNACEVLSFQCQDEIPRTFLLEQTSSNGFPAWSNSNEFLFVFDFGTLNDNVDHMSS